MLDVRKKLRPAVRSVFSAFKLREAYRSPSSRADLPQRVSIIRLENDDVILAPCAAARVRRLSEYGHRAARRRHFLELSVREESDPLSIPRPEGERCPVGSVQLFRRQLSKGLHPDRIAFFVVSRTECDGCSLHIQHRRSGEIPGEIETHLLRRRQKRSQRSLRLAGTVARPDLRAQNKQQRKRDPSPIALTRCFGLRRRNSDSSA